MYFSSKRQQYLVDQGYTFQVLQVRRVYYLLFLACTSLTICYLFVFPQNANSHSFPAIRHANPHTSPLSLLFVMLTPTHHHHHYHHYFYFSSDSYSFSYLQNLSEKADRESKLLRTKEDEMALLTTALKFDCASKDETEDDALKKASIEGSAEPSGGSGSSAAAQAVRAAQAAAPGGMVRKGGSLAAHSGVGDTVYSEFDR